MSEPRKTVHLLNYVAGNWRSLVNAIEKVGYHVEEIHRPDEIPAADVLILPGVGHFGHCLAHLSDYVPRIRDHIRAGKPFLGICVGLQALFEGSAEDPDVPGLAEIPARLEAFDNADKAVPHIGWNTALPTAAASPDADADPAAGPREMYALRPESRYYYVHTYRLAYVPGELEARGWSVATATYGDEVFVGAVARDNVVGAQFHPEKSGAAGLRFLRAFLSGEGRASLGKPRPTPPATAGGAGPGAAPATSGLTCRVIACLDVRTNDQGDLVVTKGDQYDVREKADTAAADERGSVRNLGKPVELARRYYEQGADEVTFLNITSFRDCPLADAPMLEVLRQTSKTVFVPLTVGGGIRDTVDADGTEVRAHEIARMYFLSGADKVSVGSDAVLAAEEYLAAGRRLFGNTAIEQISRAYGRQAVVVSVDPKRVYVPNGDDATRHSTVRTAFPGPRGEQYCWYACTIRGGRETRDLDVVELAQAVESMGAGELLLNSIDRDGSGAGFDLELLSQVKSAVRIPVIASSGAGRPEHFAEVFKANAADAALGAGLFHRGEYTVRQVKDHLALQGLPVRIVEDDL